MSVEDVIRLVVRGLKAVSDAPWGQRVVTTTTSDVVEVSGPRAGAPASTTWPMVMLNARVGEHRDRALPGATYLTNYNADTRTVEKRRAPRFANVTFRVVLQTRSGVNTGSGVDAISAETQLYRCMALLDAWIDDNRALAGAVLVRVDPMSPSPGNRPRPADVFQAEGTFRVDWIAVPVGTATVLPADNTLVVEAAPDRTLP